MAGAARRERERRRERVRRRSKSIAAGGAIGSFFAAAMLVLSLLGRMELTALTEELGSLGEEIAALEEQRAKLEIEYSSAIDLETVEETAVEVLGMQRPRPEQIRYEETALPDRITVIEKEQGAALWERLRQAAAFLGECFP